MQGQGAVQPFHVLGVPPPPSVSKRETQKDDSTSSLLWKEQLMAYGLLMATRASERISSDAVPVRLLEDICSEHKAPGKQRPPKGLKTRLTPDAVIANGITSLMIHNLPMTVIQKDVRDELDHSGFASLYDFLYVPYNLKTARICGYAFINLISADAAALLVSMWDQSTSLCGESTSRPIFFSAADVQGYDGHVERLRKGSKRCLRDPRFRPVLRRLPPRSQVLSAPSRALHSSVSASPRASVQSACSGSSPRIAAEIGSAGAASFNAIAATWPIKVEPAFARDIYGIPDRCFMRASPEISS